MFLFSDFIKQMLDTIINEEIDLLFPFY